MKILIAICPCGHIQSIDPDWKSCLHEGVIFGCDHCGERTTQRIGYATIERGEAEAIAGIPALPETDNQKIQAYLDYLNNFLTIDKFAEHYGFAHDKALRILSAGRKLHSESSKQK